MKKNTISAIFLGALVLAGCNSQQDTNKKIFGAAVSKYLAKEGDLCLQLTQWPVDLNEAAFRLNTEDAQTMPALEAIGIVSSKDIDIDHDKTLREDSTAQRTKIKRYTLTTAGNRFFLKKEITVPGSSAKMMGRDICYGKKSLDKVVKWEGPTQYADTQEVRVKYLYKIDNLADWAQTPVFQAAFPYSADIIQGAGKKEDQHTLKLTDLGWEPSGLE